MIVRVRHDSEGLEPTRVESQIETFDLKTWGKTEANRDTWGCIEPEVNAACTVVSNIISNTPVRFEERVERYVPLLKGCI
jgi:hypothetical protein